MVCSRKKPLGSQREGHWTTPYRRLQSVRSTPWKTLTGDLDELKLNVAQLTLIAVGKSQPRKGAKTTQCRSVQKHSNCWPPVQTGPPSASYYHYITISRANSFQGNLLSKGLSLYTLLARCFEDLNHKSMLVVQKTVSAYTPHLPFWRVSTSCGFEIIHVISLNILQQ